MLDDRQQSVITQVEALGGRAIARVRKAHNAIAVRIDAARVQQLSTIPGVRAVRPVRNYQLYLSSTVPYIGAASVQASGVDGTGVTVAVLDSGIDYTHRNLGGPGTAQAYTNAFGADGADPRNTTRDGLFPTDKVVDGFDFVGERWPNGPLAPDPDPIDFEGHGTHVADIIAGQRLDGFHKGVAPGAKLMALKVCSPVSTACSGIALLQAMDVAIDPNGDDDLSDAVDVINAVAQTEVPTAVAIPLIINAPPAIAGTYPNTATLDFAPVSTVVTGDVAFVGRGCPAESIAPGSPEDPYLTDPAGTVALIDRGSCSISLKIDRAAKAGATGVLIGLVAAGDAISFSFGGGTDFVPSLVITQATSTLIKANLAAPVNVTI